MAGHIGGLHRLVEGEDQHRRGTHRAVLAVPPDALQTHRGGGEGEREGLFEAPARNRPGSPGDGHVEARREGEGRLGREEEGVRPGPAEDAVYGGLNGKKGGRHGVGNAPEDHHGLRKDDPDFVGLGEGGDLSFGPRLQDPQSILRPPQDGGRRQHRRQPDGPSCAVPHGPSQRGAAFRPALDSLRWTASVYAATPRVTSRPFPPAMTPPFPLPPAEKSSPRAPFPPGSAPQARECLRGHPRGVCFFRMHRG